MHWVETSSCGLNVKFFRTTMSDGARESSSKADMGVTPRRHARLVLQVHAAHRCPPQRLHRAGASGKNGAASCRTTQARTLRFRVDRCQNIHLPSTFPNDFFRYSSHRSSRLDGTKKFNHGLHGAHGWKRLNSMIKYWRTSRIRRRRAQVVADTTDSLRAVACIPFFAFVRVV